MGRKKFFNFKSLFLVSFLAVAGIFSATAIINDKQVEEAPVAEKAEATYWGTWHLNYKYPDGSTGYLNMYQNGSGDETCYADAVILKDEIVWIQNTDNNWNYGYNISSGTGRSYSEDIEFDGHHGFKINTSGKYSFYFDVEKRQTIWFNYSAYSDLPPERGYYLLSNDTNWKFPGSTELDKTTGDNVAELLNFKCTAGQEFKGKALTNSSNNLADWTNYAGINPNCKVGETDYAHTNDPYTGNIIIDKTSYFSFYWTSSYQLWITLSRFTISLNQAGGSGGSSSVSDVIYGEAMPSITLPTKPGYTFGGYYTGENGTGTKYYNADGSSAAAWAEDGTTTLYAKWTANPYTLTLTVNEGISRIYYKINGAANFSYVTSTTNLNVNYNSTYYLYAEATTGYTLNSPYSTYTSSNPYNDTKTTSTQSWAPTATINTYTVTISVNNAEYGSVSQSTVASVPHGTVISTSDNKVTINGTTVTATSTAATAQYTYAFSSWTNGTATVTGDLTVTANFTITTNNYTVSFNVQGHGSAPSSQTINYGGKVSRPADPSETGYLFGGWYKESTCENEWNFNNDTVTGTTILYAKWTKLGYVEFLRADDASPQYFESIICYLNEDMPTLSELPTREGYTFAGFFYEDTGVQYYNADGTSAHVWDHNEAHLELTARWVDKYVVTITAGDGISSVYLSSNDSATSGSASGSSFDVGSTVFGFAVLEGGYAHASASWTLVSGTADTEGAIYRIGSLVVNTSSNAFGTISPISGAQDAMDFWEASFNDFLDDVCKDNGSTNFNDLLYEWNVNIYSVDYCDLKEYQKYWLTDADAGKSIGIDYSRYDYILRKYGCTDDPEEYDTKLYDFLGRFDGVQLPAINNCTPFDYFTNDENNLSTLIIVIASSISLLSVTALSVLMVKKRKRKEQ